MYICIYIYICVCVCVCIQIGLRCIVLFFLGGAAHALLRWGGIKCWMLMGTAQCSSHFALLIGRGPRRLSFSTSSSSGLRV